MRILPLELDAHRVEAEAREFWNERGVGPAPAPSGPPPPGAVTIAVGTVATDSVLTHNQLAHLIVADVAERSLRLTGKAASEALYVRPSSEVNAQNELRAELDHLAVWFGHAALAGPSRVDPTARVHEMVRSMADRGLLTARHRPLRVCPACGEPRTPDQILYHEEPRHVYLVRVRIAGTDPPLFALVWTEAVWKFVATQALLLHPDRPYVRARFRRRGIDEQILLARDSVGRLTEWLPGGTVEVLDEQPGKAWVGQVFDNPLRSEMPLLGELTAPSGTVQASPEVGEEGTGIVLLAPAHGPADAFVAESMRMPARSVVGATGILLAEPRHKYSGLPLDTAEACIGRDLVDDGAIFAELRAPCGVPRCRACGSELYWYPGRAWCLELAKVSPSTRARFAEIAIGERFPEPSEISSWPVSRAETTEDPSAPLLAECRECGRLYGKSPPENCACGGGAPGPVRRRLLGALEEPLRTWAQRPPSTSGGTVWFLLPERRRVPALVHQLLALEAAEVRPGSVRWSLLRTLPPEGSSEALSAVPPADAVRAALVRLAAGIPRHQTLAQAIVEETHRIYRIWSGTRSLLLRMAAEEYSPEERLASARPAELPAEDAAFLASFERTRLEVLKSYERGAWAAGYLRICRFMDHTVRDRYVPLLVPRLFEPKDSPGKLAAFWVLAYFMPRLAELAAPVAPHTAEAIYRALRGDESSVLARPVTPVQEPFLDPAADAALETWGDIVTAVRRGRRRLGLPAAERLRQVILIPGTEERAMLLRPHLAVLGRLLRAEQVLLHSPSDPWDGRRVEARPNVEAIKRAFPVYHRRIIKVIDQLDGRQIRSALKSQSLAVGVEGQPAIRIPPSMIDVVETLPESVIPVPWRGGEIYAEVPAGAARSAAAKTPLPAELDRVRRYLERRARPSVAGGERPSKMFVQADDPLRSVLQRHVEVLSRELGVARILIADSARLFVPAETSYGRDRRGQRFLVWVPGHPVPVRRVKSRARRVPEEGVLVAAQRVLAAASESEYISPEALERRERILLLSTEIDPGGVLTYVGPTKLGIAWDQGFRTRADFANADPERLAGMLGFGPVVAHELIRNLAPERQLPELPLPWSFTAPGTLMEVTTVEPAPPPPRAVVTTVLPPPPPESPPPVPPTPARVVEPPPAPLPNLPVPTAPQLGVRVAVGPTRSESWDGFLDALTNGKTGLWVGRVFPQPLQAAGASHDVRFLWLSATSRPNAVRPGEPEAIAAQIVASLQSGDVRAVIVEEIEYLVALNGTPAVRAMLREIDAAAHATHATVWVPVVPELLGRGTPEEIVGFATPAG